MTVIRNVLICLSVLQTLACYGSDDRNDILKNGLMAIACILMSILIVLRECLR